MTKYQGPSVNSKLKVQCQWLHLPDASGNPAAVDVVVGRDGVPVELRVVQVDVRNLAVGWSGSLTPFLLLLSS